MRRYRSALLCAVFVTALCATSGALTARSIATGDGEGTSTFEGPCDGGQLSSDVAELSLRAHNTERARLNLPHLAWNCRLERDAAQWAKALSRRGALQHASADVRRGTGENLWMGTAGHWSVEGMVGMFIDERQHYRPGRFPDVSHTGDWTDVGHYSQIVWRDTREIGCALNRETNQEVLVCRYFPAGNVMGRTAY